jgi:hypothetical protein
MTRPTLPGRIVPLLTTPFLGREAPVSTGDAPEPIDRVKENGAVFFPWTIEELGLVDSDQASGSGPSVTLPAVLGNFQVAWLAARGAAAPLSLTGDGWTSLGQIQTSAPEGWPAEMFWRIVPPGASPTIVGLPGGVLLAAEFSGVDDYDDDTPSEQTTGAPTVSHTPAQDVALLLISGVSVRHDSQPALDPAGDMLELRQGHIGSNGPEATLNYQIVAESDGSYTMGSTGTTAQDRAVIGVSFTALSDFILWLDAVGVRDEYDETFEFVSAEHTEQLRVTLDDAYRLTNATLLVGHENSGSKTIVLEGANIADYSDAVELASRTFDATGSFTADVVTFGWSSATAYRFYRFIGPGGEEVRFYDLAMYDFGVVAEHTHPSGDHPDLATHDSLGLATDAELAAHAADPDAHHEAASSPASDTHVWMPLTTVVDGEPVLVWDDDDSLIPTLVALE